MLFVNELSPSVTVIAVLEINNVFVIPEYIVRVAIFCCFPVTLFLGCLIVFNKGLRNIYHNYVIYFIAEKMIWEFPDQPGDDNARKSNYKADRNKERSR